MSGLEELRSTSEIATDGFAVTLGTYGCRVYVDLRVVADGPDEPWSALAGRLAGRAVPSVADALADLRLAPEHDAWRAELGRVVAGLGPRPAPGRLEAALARALAGVEVDRLRLAGLIRTALAEGGVAEEDLDRSDAIVRALAGAAPALLGSSPAAVRAWFGDPGARAALRVNAWDGAEFVEREAWQAWLAALAELTGTARSRRWPGLARLASDVGYRVDRILAGLALSRPARRPGPARAGASAKGSRDRGQPPGGGAG
jgi:hypothetical protein